MTKDEIRDLIMSRGYWRIHIQPLLLKEILPISADRINAIEKNVVDYVGWPFPYFPTVNTNFQEVQIFDNYVQAWTNLGQHKELFRIYKSSQFIHYFAFVDDWWEEDIHNRDYMKKRKPLTDIGIVFGILTHVTHIFKFAFNLCNSNLYEEGFKLSIEIFGLKDRVLWDGSNEFLFIRFLPSNENKILYLKEFSRENFILNYQEYSLDFLIRIYDLFSWNPSRESLKVYQDNLIKTGRIK